MLGVHVWIGLGKRSLPWGRLLSSSRLSDLVPGPGSGAGVLIAAGLAWRWWSRFFLHWREPDGLERVAEDQGFLETAETRRMKSSRISHSSHRQRGVASRPA